MVRFEEDHGGDQDRDQPRAEPDHGSHQGVPLQDEVRVRSLPHQRQHRQLQRKHRDPELFGREEGITLDSFFLGYYEIKVIGCRD